MNLQLHAVYVLGIVCAFVFGVVIPFVIPAEGYSKLSEIHSTIGRNAAINATLIAVFGVMVAALFSGLVLVARGQAPIVRFVVKMVVFAVLAASLGLFSAVLVGHLRLREPPWVSPHFLLTGAALYFLAGASGLFALWRFPAR